MRLRFHVVRKRVLLGRADESTRPSLGHPSGLAKPETKHGQESYTGEIEDLTKNETQSIITADSSDGL